MATTRPERERHFRQRRFGSTSEWSTIIRLCPIKEPTFDRKTQFTQNDKFISRTVEGPAAREKMTWEAPWGGASN
jgi:hypothetical protein